MESQPQARSRSSRLKVVAGVAGIGVVGAMSVLTVVFGGIDDSKSTSTVVIADTTTQGAPSTSMSVPSAAPTLKSSNFVGGDWAGMGKFAGGDWP